MRRRFLFQRNDLGSPGDGKAKILFLPFRIQGNLLVFDRELGAGGRRFEMNFVRKRKIRRLLEFRKKKTAGHALKRIFRGKNTPVLRIDPQGLAFPPRRGFEVEEPEFLAGVVTGGGIFIREEGEAAQENGDDFLGL
jgi:hypothetical protein